MTLRQIATINRPFEKDNRTYFGFFVEKWMTERKNMRLFISFYSKGAEVPFVSFALERAPNRPEIMILLNEDRDILGAYILSKDPVETIIETLAKNMNVEETFKVEIEEEVLEE
jgi:hypothetical protein